MVSAKSICEYYNANISKFPVVVTLDGDDVVATTKSGKEFGRFFLVDEHNQIYTYYNAIDWFSLSKGVKDLNLDYDLKTEYGILSAFIDCVYAQMSKKRNRLSEVLDEIVHSF